LSNVMDTKDMYHLPIGVVPIGDVASA